MYAVQMYVHSLIVKTFLFRAIQFSPAVQIQTIQFSVGTDFIPKTVHVSTVSVSKTVLFQTNQFSIST